MQDFIGGVIGGLAGYMLAATVHRYLIWRRSRRPFGQALPFK